MDWDIRSLSKKPFSDAAPQNFVEFASTRLGSGANGTITITHDNMETTDKIEVVVSGELAAALSAAYADGTITVTLGTDAAGAADATKNTATLIVAAINGITGATWTAVTSGTGATAISEAVTEKAFTNGHYGTPCPVAYTGYENSGTYYICTAADNSVYNTSWKTFTLSNL